MSTPSSLRSVINRIMLITILLSMLVIDCYPQNNISLGSDTYHPGRLRTVLIVESAASAAILVGVHYLWYKKFPRSRFHFFNDNREWLQMDKIGHATTAYNASAIQYNMMRWSGVSNTKSIWIGGLTALGFQTVIEIFDGFSQQWGFSKGDMLANIFGSALFMAQQFAWNEQKARLKFSFHATIFPKYNPGELGSNKWQRWLKDYNGQTYWLSLNPASFVNNHTGIPRWVNLDLGYGADGMTGATTNPDFIGNRKIPAFRRTRKYFLSLDADINRFSDYNQLLYTFPNIIKLPAPALEFKKGVAVRFRSFYF